VRPRFSTVNQTVDALHSQEIVHRIEKEIHMKFWDFKIPAAKLLGSSVSNSCCDAFLSN